MKKFILLLLFLTSTIASAETVWVLHSAKPGGNSGKMNYALAGELEKNGHQTKHEFVNGCRGIQQWLVNNPKAPAVFDFQVVEDITKDVDPSNDQACDVGFNKNSVLAISVKASLKFCAMTDTAINQWLNEKAPVKIGYHRVVPGSQIMAEGVAKEINPNSRFVHIKGGAQLAQALVSGDIDIGAVSYSANLEQAGAKCYVETDLVSAKNTPYKIKQLNPTTKWKDAGQISVWVGHNVPMAEFRKYAITVVNTHPDILKNIKLGAERDGVAVGKTVDQQWTILSLYKNQFRK